MAEKAEAEQTEAEVAAAEAALAEGFDADPPAPSTPPAKGPPPDLSAFVRKPVQEEPAVYVPPPPRYVRLTEDEAQRLRSAADETVNLKQQLSRAFGTLGNMQQVINQIRNQTPAGAAVEITDEDFAELREDFPELEQRQRVGLERILKRANLRGTAQAAPATVDPEAMRSVAATIVHGEGLEDLDDLHPGWREIVGQPNDSNNPYRRWLANQSDQYQELIHGTYSAAITKRSIDRFRADQAKARAPVARQTPSRPEAARRERIAAAVAPRGNGQPPAPRQPTALDRFHEGFNE